MVSEFKAGAVRGFIHQPGREPHSSLVITHGAGGNCDAPLLVAFARTFSEAGFLVLRCDLPFRQKRASGPPVPAWAQEDQEGLRQAVHAVRRMAISPVVLGGHSYGGRQASLTAAADPDLADGLLLLSYPLHPPKRETQMRTAHWPKLHTPAFFVHGTRDPFGSSDEMQQALALISAPTALVLQERAGHDLMKGRFDIEQCIIQPLQRFMGLAGRRSARQTKDL